MLKRKLALLVLPLLLAGGLALAAAPAPKPVGTPGPGGRPPEKLSDLYRFFTYAVREGLHHWGGGPGAAARKERLFDDRALSIALERLAPSAVAV